MRPGYHPAGRRITGVRSLLTGVAAAALTMAVLSADTPRPGIDLPSLRGPGARGVAEGAPAPATWDVPNNKNVKWRVAVPGLSHSSPVVWGQQVCTATAVAKRAASSSSR